MNLLFGHDQDVAAWVASRIPYMAGESFGPCAAIGILDRGGVLVGGVVYHNYFPKYGNIELSFAADTAKWLTPAIISALLRYPFASLGCRRITGVTPRRATSARRFLEKFGFKREGSVRLGFGDDNAIISGLLREEWAQHRFNVDARPQRLTHGQEHSGTPASA